MPFPFEQLNVWIDSQDFVTQIYKLAKKLPKSEEFGLKSQLRRASISITLNIAEGHSRNVGKEQAKFYRYAYGSLMEVISGLYIAKRLEYLLPNDLEPIILEAEKIARMLSGLKTSTLRRTHNP